VAQCLHHSLMGCLVDHARVSTGARNRESGHGVPLRTSLAFTLTHGHSSTPCYGEAHSTEQYLSVPQVLGFFPLAHHSRSFRCNDYTSHWRTSWPELMVFAGRGAGSVGAPRSALSGATVYRALIHISNLILSVWAMLISTNDALGLAS
jgi:hypothetical protein